MQNGPDLSILKKLRRLIFILLPMPDTMQMGAYFRKTAVFPSANGPETYVFIQQVILRRGSENW
jgi:hypothetical protein